jgi:hypothetical protein
MIRATPANASDGILCSVLGQNAVRRVTLFLSQLDFALFPSYIDLPARKSCWHKLRGIVILLCGKMYLTTSGFGFVHSLM